MEDLFNSSYNALFVTSNSLHDFENEKREEELYQQKLAEMQTKREELVRKQTLEAERSERLLLEMVTMN